MLSMGRQEGGKAGRQDCSVLAVCYDWNCLYSKYRVRKWSRARSSIESADNINVRVFREMYK